MEVWGRVLDQHRRLPSAHRRVLHPRNPDHPRGMGLGALNISPLPDPRGDTTASSETTRVGSLAATGIEAPSAYGTSDAGPVGVPPRPLRGKEFMDPQTVNKVT